MRMRKEEREREPERLRKGMTREEIEAQRSASRGVNA